jgi:uncharacterized OB-fold protein
VVETRRVNRIPAVEGWYTIDEKPHLIGAKCGACGTYVFPPRENGCPNPSCDGDVLGAAPLSTRGRVWSYTENRYAPPPPYKAADPFEPYALVAVELADEGLIVLGQAPKGVLAVDLRVGMEVQLETDVLWSETADDGTVTEHIVYVWAPAAPSVDESGSAS